MTETIEQLKRQYTDQFVEIEGDRPELARFQGYTGQVKTVNMSGRALVQFDAWNNIGWYDIDLSYLRIVPQPDPSLKGVRRAEAAAAPAQIAPGAKPVAVGQQATDDMLETARSAKASVKPAGKLSTADILAAARANKAKAEANAAETSEPAEYQPEPASTPERALPASPALTPGKRPSVDEMVAWCRAHDSK